MQEDMDDVEVVGSEAFEVDLTTSCAVRHARLLSQLHPRMTSAVSSGR